MDLSSHSLTGHVNKSHAHDSVELGEHSEDDGVTEKITVALCHTCNTIGTYLSLTDTREETSKTACKTCTEDRCSLKGCRGRREQVEHVLAHVEASEAIQTLCTREGGEHEGITEELAVLLQSTDSSVTRNCYTIGTADSGKTNHQGYAQISNKQICVHNL